MLNEQELEDVRVKNALYDSGYALLQYVIPEEKFLARYRDKLYEIHDLTLLSKDITDCVEFGIRKAPIDKILTLPKTRIFYG